jgi:hypothetical protein
VCVCVCVCARMCVHDAYAGNTRPGREGRRVRKGWGVSASPSLRACACMSCVCVCVCVCAHVRACCVCNLRDGQRGAPIIFQNVQANPALVVNVAVVNLGGEADLRRLEGVLCRELDVQPEHTT